VEVVVGVLVGVLAGAYLQQTEVLYLQVPLAGTLPIALHDELV